MMLAQNFNCEKRIQHTKSKSTNMEDVEFTPLCADLFRHYRTFDENFQDAGDKSNEEVSFILFGVTGAGKVSFSTGSPSTHIPTRLSYPNTVHCSCSCT